MNEASAVHYEPIVVSSESTVVSEYVADKKAAAGYQSEAQLETEFIRFLGGQGINTLRLTRKASLEAILGPNPGHWTSWTFVIRNGITSFLAGWLVPMRASSTRPSGFKRTTFSS